MMVTYGAHVTAVRVKFIEWEGTFWKDCAFCERAKKRFYMVLLICHWTSRLKTQPISQKGFKIMAGSCVSKAMKVKKSEFEVEFLKAFL